jgi:hypothetical protein
MIHRGAEAPKARSQLLRLGAKLLRLGAELPRLEASSIDSEQRLPRLGASSIGSELKELKKLGSEPKELSLSLWSLCSEPLLGA